MILSQNLRKGTMFLLDAEPWVVLDYSHMKKARSDAVIRVKIRNVLTGVIKDDSFKSSQKFDEAELENLNYQYLYSDGDTGYFLDESTYEQVSFDISNVRDILVFLTEGDSYQCQIYEGKLVNILIPKILSYKVEYTEPGFKGDTSGTTLKPAKLSNGLEIQVPLFINIGDTVSINTDMLTYKERVFKA